MRSGSAHLGLRRLQRGQCLPVSERPPFSWASPPTSAQLGARAPVGGQPALLLRSGHLCRRGAPSSHPGQPAAAYLVKAGVLDVVGSHLLLALDLHVDLQADGPRHRGLVGPFLWKGGGGGGECAARSSRGRREADGLPRELAPRLLPQEWLAAQGAAEVPPPKWGLVCPRSPATASGVCVRERGGACASHCRKQPGWRPSLPLQAEEAGAPGRSTESPATLARGAAGSRLATLGGDGGGTETGRAGCPPTLPEGPLRGQARHSVTPPRGKSQQWGPGSGRASGVRGGLQPVAPPPGMETPLPISTLKSQRAGQGDAVLAGPTQAVRTACSSPHWPVSRLLASHPHPPSSSLS